MKKEGGNIASYNVNYETCKSYCSGEPACNSFTYCSIGELKCHLKRKVVNPNKPRKNKNSCTTSYPNSCKGTYLCNKFIFQFPPLIKPSVGFAVYFLI